jgi:hypothetical protein
MRATEGEHSTRVPCLRPVGTRHASDSQDGGTCTHLPLRGEVWHPNGGDEASLGERD